MLKDRGIGGNSLGFIYWPEHLSCRFLPVNRPTELVTAGSRNINWSIRSVVVRSLVANDARSTTISLTFIHGPRSLSDERSPDAPKNLVRTTCLNFVEVWRDERQCRPDADDRSRRTFEVLRRFRGQSRYFVQHQQRRNRRVFGAKWSRQKHRT